MTAPAPPSAHRAAPPPGADSAAWQQEADLLADGRDFLERWCRSTRFAHLYPEGPNLAILFASYQTLDQRRTVGRAPQSPRRQRRMLRRLILRAAKRDALSRNQRIAWRYPAPRPTVVATTAAVAQALEAVDADVRPLLAARLAGRADPDLDPATSMVTDTARRRRAEQQFRDALSNAALARPDELLRLPAAVWPLLATPAPTKRSHPVATLLLVKFPLRLAAAICTLLVVSYLGAWVFFNDAVLGRFVSKNVSGLLDGDLELGSIHWGLPLIFDLVTGRPTHVVVKDVSVWEPYKRYGGERKRRTAHAVELDATLVLHEIIPWNRLGIPRFVDIPWVLHFPTVHAQEPVWITVREYTDVRDDGTQDTLLSLVDAFIPLTVNPDRKGLSFAVDAATLSTLTLELDIGGEHGWGTLMQLAWANFTLHFVAPEPNTPMGVLPFSFLVDALASQGELRIDDLSLPLEDLVIERLATGEAGVPLGALGFVGRTEAAGTEVALEGSLSSVFPGDTVAPPMGVDLRATTSNGEGLVRHIIAELDLPDDSVVADHAAITASISGPVADPQYRVQADGLAIDALGEPLWIADEVHVALSLGTHPVPDRWQDRFEPGARRRTARFTELRGEIMSGTFALADEAPVAMVVFPQDATESWLLAADLVLADVDPGQLFVTDDDLSARLSGVLAGALSVHELVLAPAPPPGEETPGPRVDMTLSRHTLVRDRGPQQDGLPKRLSADGRIVYDPTTGLDLEDLVVTTDGTRLSATGGLTAGWSAFKETKLALKIDDGRAFSRAFGLDAYFADLQANLTVSGPVGAPRSPPGRLVLGNLGLWSPPPSATGPPDAGGDGRGPRADGSSGPRVDGGGHRGPRDRTTEASIWLERGVLRISSKDARLYGGHGTVELWVYLFEGGALSSDPKIKGTAHVTGIRPGRVTQGKLAGLVDLDITLDGGDGRPARVDQLQVSGLVQAPELRFAGTTYRDARMRFALSRESLAIQELVLPVHRGVSPFHGPNVTIPVGELVATGSVGLQADPKLDLRVGARGVPLDVVARLLEVDQDFGGRIDSGTELTVGGTLARPRVDGTVNLVGLAASGVVLGGGMLRVESSDAPAQDELAAHRELRIEGELSAADTGRGSLQWTVDAVAAFGQADARGRAPVDAEIDIGFDRLSLASLVGDLSEAGLTANLRGAFEGLSAHVTTCGDGRAMLSACAQQGPQRALQVDLQLERAWVSGGQGKRAAGSSPCQDATTLCSDTRLDASLAWPVVTLDRPWRLSTGGEHPADLSVSGSFDLSTGTATDPPGAAECTPPTLSSIVAAAPIAGTRPQAQVSGTIDLASLAPLLGGYGLVAADGRVDLDLSVWGTMPTPEISGRATLASSATSGATPLSLTLAGVAFPLQFSDLDLRVQPGWLTAAGKLEVQGETLTFGTVRGENTGVGLAGKCAGSWAVAAEGTVSHSLLEAFAGKGVVPRGSVELDRLVAAGPGPDEDPLDRLEGTLRLRRQGLALALTETVPTIELTAGRVDFARCRQAECGPSVAPGSVAVWIGGKAATLPGARARASGSAVPTDALLARVGPRGRAAVWGVTHLPPDFSHAEGTAIRATLSDVAYRDYDARGRPVYEMEISTDDLLLQGGDPLVLSGNVTADRARYVKDAVQGVEILALTDEIDLPEAPPPQILRGLQFDLRAQTDSPLRVENNIAHGVEANVALKVTGTYDVPELSGRFDVEPGGTVDIPFLTGTYEIQQGRVTLEREINNAGVDIVALRHEPVYIQNEARQIQLRLGGTVSAITWSCTAEGDVSGAVDTTRGCLDYLVLGAGDVQIDQSSGVQRLGGGGLANARKSLQVVGHVTEFNFGERIEQAVPRYESFVPDVHLRLGQIGPELDIATPPEWFDFDWAHARFGWDYMRGYPGFLLLQSRRLSFQLEILDPVTLEFSRDIRTYLNERIIFDPLRQRTLELRFDFSLPSLR